MPLPNGILTGTVTFGQAVTLVGGHATSMVFTIKPTHALLHVASGVQLLDFEEEVTLAEGMPGTLELPYTDQDGFVDGEGNAFKNWAYFLIGKWRRGNVTRGFSKTIQITSGQTGSVDLDAIVGTAITPALSAPTARVTSIANLVGDVSVQDLIDAGLGAGNIYDGGQL